MAEVGSAWVTVAPSAKGFGSALGKQVGGDVDSVGKSTGKRFGTAFKVAGAAVLGGAALLGGFLKGAFEEARDAQKVGALTASTIKATGGAANVTAKQVGDLAGALSSKTGIDDEVIQSGQNMLLTFKNIRNEAGKGNDIFNQSSAALIDMAAAMGTEPKQAAIQLGKALNDPVKGVAALGRVGIQFTEGQKEQIKTLQESGNVMGAQKIVLKELNSQFKGAAAAQATAGDKAKVAWGNLQETVGTALLPLWDKILNGATSVMLYLTNNIGPAFAKMAGFIEPAKAAVAGLFSSFSGGGAASGLMATLTSIGAAIAANFLPVLRSMAATFTTVVLPAILRLAGFLRANLVPIFIRVGQIVATQVVPIIASLARFFYGTLYPAVVRIATQIAGSLRPVFVALFRVIQTSVLPAVQRLLVKFREWQPTIQKVIVVVVKVVGAILRLAAAILGRVLPPLIRFAGFLLRNVVRAVTAVISILVRIVRSFFDTGRAVANAAAAFGRFADRVDRAIRDALRVVGSFIGKARNALSGAGSALMDAGRRLIDGLISGIGQRMEAAVQKVRDGLQRIRNMLPGSPIKDGPLKSWNRGGAGKRLINQGIIAGIDSQRANVDAAMTRLTRRIQVAAPHLSSALTAAGVPGSSAASGLRPIVVNDRSGDPTRTAREVVRREAWAGAV